MSKKENKPEGPENDRGLNRENTDDKGKNPSAEKEKITNQQQTEKGRSEQTPDITGQQKKTQQGVETDEEKSENPSQKKQQKSMMEEDQEGDNAPTTPGSGV